MVSSSSNNSFVILELNDPLMNETHFEQKEIFISTDSISTWNISSILDSQIIKVQVDRNKLGQKSTFFHSLLTGGFSESRSDSVSVHWKRNSVIDVLKFIFGVSLNISVDNFITLMEGALFFGVEDLLLECMKWFSEATSTRDLYKLRVPLASIIEIWSFGLEHGIGSIQEQCTGYLARNFMQAISCSSFVEVPYHLLSCCLEHPDLTTDSERHLAEALLRWIESNERPSQDSAVLIKEDYNDILKVVRISLLPLWFVAGMKRGSYFSEHAVNSISPILCLTNNQSVSLLRVLRDRDLDLIRFRLTCNTERIDLSGCPQITPALLFLSLLPSSGSMDTTTDKKIEKYFSEILSLNKGIYAVPQNLFLTLSFEAVQGVDVSKCPRLHLDAAIQNLLKSFPSLKTLRASYCVHFKLKTLFHLVKNCPQVNEVYLNVDMPPVLPAQTSIISTRFDDHQHLDVSSYKVLKERPSSSNITKLILKGRTEIDDLDLINISLLCGSLCYLNLKGCISLTDMGISEVIRDSFKLHSIVVSDTHFGKISISVLCSDLPSSERSPGIQHDSISLASGLQKLHIGGCKSVDVISLSQLLFRTCMLESLSLRATSLGDDAINNFLGSSLERLNVSETAVSRAALAQIIGRNSGLKRIKLRGCKYLCHNEGNALSYVFSKCKLEDVEFGWGFSSPSIENLGPAIRSLRYLTLGLGASLSEQELILLPTLCPLLESVILKFQVLSDNIVTNITESLPHLRVFGLSYCLGDLSSLSFRTSMPNLRKLQLERVIPWMTNDDLIILTQNCTSLVELTLSGCTRLNSDSQAIISSGWPGLISIHLEDCGEVTSNGVTSLFDCIAIEDLLLRHNGPGIKKSFVIDAAAKMPMLRKISLDLCDASEGGFETPSYRERYFLSSVTIARCKMQKCGFELQTLEACRRSVHKESIVLEWNNEGLGTTVVKERIRG
ncbi:hypothetical protein ACHQM5_001852 [Ranunculus cassubicifolius]